MDIFTYNDVVEGLEKICCKIELQLDVSMIIKNYIEVIIRDILKDQKLIDICNKIYNKHKKILNEYRTFLTF